MLLCYILSNHEKITHHRLSNHVCKKNVETIHIVWYARNWPPPSIHEIGHMCVLCFCEWSVKVHNFCIANLLAKKNNNFGGLAEELNNRIPEARELTFWFNLLIQSCCRFGSQIMQTRFDIPTQIRSGRRACPSWRNGSFDSPNGTAIEEKKRTVSILKLRNHENVSVWPSLNLPRLH